MSSLRPLMILPRTTSLRTKRPSMKKSSKLLDSSIQTATCSSILKDSNFPDHLELQPGGSESEGISVLKVCPYSYCSLHGHRNAPLPPLRRFISMRRRQLKTQKSIKLGSQSLQSRKSSSHLRKGMQANKITSGINASNAHKHDPNVDHPKYIDVYEGDLESISSEANTSTGVSDDVFDASRSLTPDVSVESSAINSSASYGSMSELLEEQTAANEEKNEDSLQEHPFSVADSESDCNVVEEKTQIEKPKNVGLWNLIYQHMVSGIAAEDEKLPCHNRMDKKEEEEDANVNSFPGMNKSDSYSDFSGIDQNMGRDDHDKGNHKIQLYKRNAIKLVQEAFDKILSEIPDQSCDDQSINRNGPEERKAESKRESKSNQQTPKSWSNLKKIIILKRFVKALEKVRNINPRKPRYLPVQPQPEAEKVHLRHQTTGERKNSAEWMLDYALQQVVSTLAPAQKTKVALLVQAFETVVPLPETETSPSISVAASSQATPVDRTSSLYQKGSGYAKETKFGIVLRKISSSHMNSKEEQDQLHNSCTAEEHIPVSFSKLNEPSSESDCTHSAVSSFASETTAMGLKEQFGATNPSNGDQNCMVKDDEPHSINYSLPELGEQNLHDEPLSMSADVVSISHDESPVNGEVLQEVTKEASLVSFSGVHDHVFGFNNQKMVSNCEINSTGKQSDEPKSQIQENLAGIIADCNVVSSVAASEQLEESATRGETLLRNKFLQAFAQLDESKSGSTEQAHEKQKNTRLWYLIYKHMVSGNTNPLDERADNEGQRSDANTSYEMNNADSPQSSSVTNQDRDMENHAAGNQKMEFQKIEAIRMVEEAIDEIPLPDAQDDSPDDQSVNSDVIPDTEHLEKQPGKGGEFSISTSTCSTEKSYEESNSTKMEQRSTMCLNSDDSATTEKVKITFEGNRPELPARKSWSNLKKLILLKRFVKALEKVNVKPFNPQKPRFLPLDPEEAAEKVQLRHQDMEDRKNADEWMLDYALQNVVAKLTPARKRKVQLLVEAFETVIPTTES
ncbi:hypothetical protein JCGZ_22462 [Jatropha curcas]|uniref:Calmodulin-binding domain-containing protein n=2 Tax=Jatropha curcas TaxID=180498 RepID=A0A067JQK9_JATCU|nr:hypothetical protein JCGZ_22462 [Jatropha curcas]